MIINKVSHQFNRIKRIIITSLYKIDGLKLDAHSRVFEHCFISGKKISIGKYTCINQSCSLTVTDSGEIKIGDNCGIGPFSQISASNKIVIGNGVRTGASILITDNAHGKFEITDLSQKVDDREIVSKGPVIIEDNVWIGAKASILPNVTVGEGSIIGANSVVTKNVPPYSMVAGNPAKIIRTCILSESK